MRVLLFGDKASVLKAELDAHTALELVDEAPDVVLCYGGDGTLLEAERRWPSVPKAPVRNSLRGNRCMAHPGSEIVRRLAEGLLIPTQYMKLGCALRFGGAGRPERTLTAMNEFNVHMGRINSAVRWRMWLDDEPYEDGKEILGDGFVVATPFGSTAYFNHITRGFFYTGIGIAFKSTSEHTNHMVVSEDVSIRILITRGPAVLAFDNSPEYIELLEGSELRIQRHPDPAIIYTWSYMKRTSDDF